jgi:CHAT domain-containing protein
LKPQSTTKQDLFLKNDTTQRYIKWSIFTIIIFFVSLKSYAQSNIARYEKLIENNNFQELERLYSTEPIQNLTFLQFIRHKASDYSNSGMNEKAIDIMNFCCELDKLNRKECDTVRLNNLHQLARYLSFSKQYEQAILINQKCLKSRLNCPDINPLDIAKSYNNIGVIYLNRQIFDSSLVNFNMAYFHLRRGDFKNAAISFMLYNNYILNSIFLGNSKDALKLLKEWINISNETARINITVEIKRFCYELVFDKNFDDAMKFHDVGKKLVSELFGKNSPEYFLFESGFAAIIGNAGYDDLAYAQIKKIDNQKRLARLSPFYQLVIGNNIAVSYMNLGYDSIGLNKYLELKDKFIPIFKDSNSAFLLMSNLAICYKKLGDYNKMRETRDLFYSLIDKTKYNPENSDLYYKNLDRDKYFYYSNDDFFRYEFFLNKIIDFYIQTGDIENELFSKLKLSNYYIFDISNGELGLSLLNEVQKYIVVDNDVSKLAAYFNYYYAEYYRWSGSEKQYDYYQSSIDSFEKLKFYPIEYENSLRRVAHNLLIQGRFEDGSLILKRYLYSNNKDTLNIDFIEKKINCLDELSTYKTEAQNNEEAIELIDFILNEFGYENRVSKKAINLLHDKVLNDSLKFSYILGWCNSSNLKESYDYYAAKIALANYYYDRDNYKLSDSVWNSIIQEVSLQTIDLSNKIKLQYLNYTVNSRFDYNQGIYILNSLNVSPENYEKLENQFYFDIYLGKREFKLAWEYLVKKESSLKSNFKLDSEEFYFLYKDQIKYFKIIGVPNLEKQARENLIDWLYLYQSNNRLRIISEVNSYASLLNINDLNSKGLMFIEKVKSDFDIRYATTQSTNELFLGINEMIIRYNLCLKTDVMENLDTVFLLQSILQIRLKELVNQNMSKEERFFIDFLVQLANIPIGKPSDQNLEIFFKNVFDTYKNIPNNISQKEEGNEGESFWLDLKLRNKIAESNIDQAKKIAFANRAYEILETIYFKEDKLDSALFFRFLEERNDVFQLVENSKCLLDGELEEKRNSQKWSLNFMIGRYLIGNEIMNSKSKELIFELIINNYNLISGLNKDLFDFYRSSDSVTKNQFVKFSNRNINDTEFSYNEELDFMIKLTERESYHKQWISYSDIQNSLDDSTALVLNYFYQYRFHQDSINDKSQKEEYYITFILQPNKAIISIIDSSFIGKEENILSYLENGLMNVNYINTTSYGYNKLWKNIDINIPKNIRKIYFMPDGIYNSVNISTLYDERDELFILDKYEIQISQIDDMITNHKIENKSIIEKAVLVGYPNYQNQTETTIFSPSVKSLNLKTYYNSNLTRNSLTKSLPGTKKEIESIRNIFNSEKISTSIFLSSNATENNVKSISSPDILHIATHGFFKSSLEGNPMLNSGLLLAGCDNTKPSFEDGYLSAYEMSFLDLEKTELVVLSACETGKGLLKDGDGIFGLKQGVLNAGAQNIIMSLWKVDDKVTQEFMSRFYEIWLHDKTTIREAFNKTQLEIKAKYPEPYYWGAFILVGELN